MGSQSGVGFLGPFLAKKGGRRSLVILTRLRRRPFLGAKSPPKSGILADFGGVSPTPETVYVFEMGSKWVLFQKRTQSLGWVQPWVGTHGFEGFWPGFWGLRPQNGPFWASIAYGDRFWAFLGHFWLFGVFLAQKCSRVGFLGFLRRRHFFGGKKWWFNAMIDFWFFSENLVFRNFYFFHIVISKILGFLGDFSTGRDPWFLAQN